MGIEFKSFDNFDRGILYKQLLDAYSFNSKWEEKFAKEWKDYDGFFYANLAFTNMCGFVTVLNGTPIGHISWDPRDLPEYVEIGHNCIETKYKGKGYGKIQLKEAIIRIKRYENIKKIVVTTNENLVAAQHNYESAGFEFKQKRNNNDSIFTGKYMDYELILNNQ